MGGRGHYFLFTKFFEIFYMLKISYMVALDSFATFSPNLSKFSGRREELVRWLCDILIFRYSDKFFKISLLSDLCEKLL